MGKLIDITGKSYGLLKVDSFAEMRRNEKGHTTSWWNCTCRCGKKVIVAKHSLTSGNVQSCGCLKAKNNMERFTRHGLSKTRLYKIYSMMKDRCCNSNSTAYDYYGGRGISVCEEWQGEHGFEHFYAWAVQNGYSDDLTIDRRNSNGNYEPTNCRWIPFVEQAKNKRNCHLIYYNGEIKTLSEWSRELQIARSTIRKYEKMFNGDGELAIKTILTESNNTRKIKEVRRIRMNYIKAKFLKGDKPSGRAYTYRCAEELKAGEMVIDAKGSKLMVVDELVDMAWVGTYGADKVAVVKKYVEPVAVGEREG